MTDRLDLSLGYRYRDRQAEESAVFDIEQHQLFMAFELRLGGKGTVYGRAAVMQGDLVSSGAADPAILGAARVLVADPALTTAAWQLDGTHREIELGYQYPIGELFDLDFTARFTSATATHSIDYRRVTARAALRRRF